jgi:hypothetical protein
MTKIREFQNNLYDVLILLLLLFNDYSNVNFQITDINNFLN